MPKQMGEDQSDDLELDYDLSMFSCASPKAWNSLPLSLREIETLSLFKKRLKAFYFNLAFEDITTVRCQYFAAYCSRISTSVEY